MRNSCPPLIRYLALKREIQSKDFLAVLIVRTEYEMLFGDSFKVGDKRWFRSEGGRVLTMQREVTTQTELTT